MVSFFIDECDPNVFVTTLRLNGYDVDTAMDVLGEGTPDRELLKYCGNTDRFLITNDKKDFTSDISESTKCAGIVIYTDPLFFRDEPDENVCVLERILRPLTTRESRRRTCLVRAVAFGTAQHQQILNTDPRETAL